MKTGEVTIQRLKNDIRHVIKNKIYKFQYSMFKYFSIVNLAKR